MEAVYEAAQRVADVARQLSRRTGTDAGNRAELWIDERVTFATVARVLYSIAQAGFSDFDFVVDGGVIRMTSAMTCDRRETGTCLAPDLWVAPDGVTVVARETTRDNCLVPLLGGAGRLRERAERLDVTVGDDALVVAPREERPSAEPPGPAWGGHVVLRADGACPSVPSTGGVLEVAGLERHLAAVQALAPGCRRNTVTTAEQVRWRDLAQVLGVVVVERGLDRALLGADFDGAPDCTDAVRIDQLTGGATDGVPEQK